MKRAVVILALMAGVLMVASACTPAPTKDDPPVYVDTTIKATVQEDGGEIETLASKTCVDDCEGSLYVFNAPGCGRFTLEATSRFHWSGQTWTVARFKTSQWFCAFGIVDWNAYVAGGTNTHVAWYDYMNGFFSQNGTPYFSEGGPYTYRGVVGGGVKDVARGNFEWCAGVFVFRVCSRYQDQINSFMHYDGSVYYHIMPGRTL